MKQWLKFKGTVLALALLLALEIPVYAAQVPAEASAVMEKAAKNGLKQENGKYYYYKKGVKVKNTWITISKKEYYFKSDGAAAVGWNKIGKKAYYFNAKAVKVKNKKVDGVKLNAKGEASLENERVALIFTAKSVVAKNTKSSQSKAQKLKSCYEFMLNCGYAGKFYPVDTPDWEVKYAADMLENRKGNCYSFAAAFGMLARECGYNAKIVTGQISKDGGETISHAWVEIGGKVYDPQTQQTMGIDCYGKAYAQITQVSYTVGKKV